MTSSDEARFERDRKEATPKLEDKLDHDVARRADSLGLDLNSYLTGLHLDDRTLEFDRAIVATIVAWFPVVALMVALAFTPQGKDSLAEVSGYLAAIFLVLLVVLDVVSTIFSTNLVTAWFFPRIAKAAKGGELFWPRISKLEGFERKGVPRSTCLDDSARTHFNRASTHDLVLRSTRPNWVAWNLDMVWVFRGIWRNYTMDGILDYAVRAPSGMAIAILTFRRTIRLCCDRRIRGFRSRKDRCSDRLSRGRN